MKLFITNRVKILSTMLKSELKWQKGHNQKCQTVRETPELLKITDDPLSYVKEEIRKMNEEYRVGKVEHTFSTNYNERVEQTDDEAFRIYRIERWVLFSCSI